VLLKGKRRRGYVRVEEKNAFWREAVRKEKKGRKKNLYLMRISAEGKEDTRDGRIKELQIFSTGIDCHNYRF